MDRSKYDRRPDEPGEWLTSNEAEDFLGFGRYVLTTYRVRGIGPRYHKCPENKWIHYDLEELKRYRDTRAYGGHGNSKRDRARKRDAAK